MDLRSVRTDEPEVHPTARQSSRAAQTKTAGSLLPIAFGTALTVGFYAIIPHLPIYQELAQRYFCSHPLEYATAGLFFVGIAILLLKGLGLKSERAALNAGLLDERQLSAAIDPLKTVEQVETRLHKSPAGIASTLLGQRIGDVCSYIRGRRSSAGLEEHLKYLAEMAAERMHGSYALVRTITWAVPILGFLGTVIGITIAIANVTPEQLDTSLGDVTGGLAVAFDTTALALALSMLLVFSSFVIERSEQRILADVEDAGIRQIARLFPDDSAHTPIARAETEAAEMLLKKTETLIDWQTKLWRESLESLRERWIASLEGQQSAFDAVLKQGMSATLSSHTGQLADLRNEFVRGYEAVGKQMTAQLAAVQQTQKLQLDESNRHASQLWSGIHAEVDALRKELKAQTQQTLKAMSQQAAGWQQGIKESAVAMTGQLHEMRKQGEVLLRVVEQEEHLTRVEARLAENLQTLKTAETLDETLHSLNAAIHLLTARTVPKAA